MDEFFQIWCKVKWAYGLSRTVKKSIYDGFEMRIYSNDKLIIKEHEESEETLYLHATLALIRYVKSHDVEDSGAHA